MCVQRTKNPLEKNDFERSISLPVRNPAWRETKGDVEFHGAVGCQVDTDAITVQRSQLGGVDVNFVALPVPIQLRLMGGAARWKLNHRAG